MTWPLVTLDLRLHLNPRCDRNAVYGSRQQIVIDRSQRQAAHETIARWPGYAPTPLVDLPDQAARLGIAGLRVKHEGRRFTLNSFKALGGAYGVFRVLEYETGATVDDLAGGRIKDRAARVTLCCATDGNHGRAVAWAAGLAGARCIIYLHEHVSQGREQAIARYGADIVRVNGVYDDAVRGCAKDAERNGWAVVSDTAWPGYTEIPSWVMQGYTVIMAETMAQMDSRQPSHIFVQAGVGGLAGAVLAPLWQDLGSARPYLIVVEPHEADGLYQSVLQGHPAPARGSLDSVMACLSAGEISPLAWSILDTGADAFLTITDSFAQDAMRSLATGETPLVAGESGAAGLAGLIAVRSNPMATEAVELGPTSDVLVIASEGATDPEIYTRIVGTPPHDIGESL